MHFITSTAEKLSFIELEFKKYYDLRIENFIDFIMNRFFWWFWVIQIRPVSWTVLKTQFFSLQTPKNTSYDLEDILDYHRNDIIDEFKGILKNDFLKDFSHDYGETFTVKQKIEAQEKRWDCFVFVFERLKKMRPNELMNLSYKQKSYKTALSNPTSKIILNETILEDSEIDVLKTDF